MRLACRMLMLLSAIYPRFTYKLAAPCRTTVGGVAAYFRRRSCLHRCCYVGGSLGQTKTALLYILYWLYSPNRCLAHSAEQRRVGFAQRLPEAQQTCCCYSCWSVELVLRYETSSIGCLTSGFQFCQVCVTVACDCCVNVH
jgi:hypothetical protein